MYELVSIMYTVLYSVCVNADLLTPDHVASTLERTDESQYYLMPSRLVCPQCDIEIIVPNQAQVSISNDGRCAAGSTHGPADTHNTMQGGVPVHVHDQACMLT